MGFPSLSGSGGSAGPSSAGSDIQGLTNGTSGYGNRGFINNFSPNGEINGADSGSHWLPYAVAGLAVVAAIIFLRR